MILTTNTDFQSDLMEVVRLFYPANFLEINIEIKLYTIEEENLTINTSISDENKTTELSKVWKIDQDFPLKKCCKIALYELLSKHLNKSMPWGSLTGIRPSKLVYDMMNKGMSLAKSISVLRDKYYVSEEKCNLLIDLITAQRNFVLTNLNDINLYINIPFCVSRCSYCSFISALISESKNFIDLYIDALIKDIEETKKIISQKHYFVKSIYIGGGTPTSFTAEQLDRILSHIGYNVAEFTIEAGRPDTITDEKLQVFKKYGVTRISINPQTFNDDILKKIGRNHTSEEIIKAFKLARNYPFSINMDLIAGLPGETIKSFKNSVDMALGLNPESITVHTLSLKRASTYSNEQIDIFGNLNKVSKMVDYARENISENGYVPYYLYRQKNMVAGLENVGYSKMGHFCRFNIDSMEETISIIACGANGISKRLFEGNRIERFANVKSIKDYIERIDEMIEKKKKLFE